MAIHTPELEQMIKATRLFVGVIGSHSTKPLLRRVRRWTFPKDASAVYFSPSNIVLPCPFARARAIGDTTPVEHLGRIHFPGPRVHRFFTVSRFPRGTIGAMGLRGPKARSAAEHIARGTFRADRHGPRPATAEDGAIAAAWRMLAEAAGIPPSAPRLPDPLEELLQRQGIEILPEDREPNRSKE